MVKPTTITDNATHQPHDKFVKALLGDISQAQALLETYLPRKLLAQIDLKCLSLQPNHYVDHLQRAYAVDILYKTAIQGEDAYIWILIEHQSTYDPWLPVRLFKYIATIWDDLRKKQLKKSTATIPLVFPLVIHNGTKPYPRSLSLIDMIKPKVSQEWFAELFTAPFNLIDLPAIPDQQLREQTQHNVTLYTFLMLLKHIYSKDLPTLLQSDLLPYLQALDRLGHREHLMAMLLYIYQLNEYLNEQMFSTIIEGRLSSDIEEKIMSVASQVRAKGEAIGEARGEARGRKVGKIEGQKEAQAAIAKQLLNKGQDPTFVAEITGLSLAEVTALTSSVNPS